MPALMKSTDKTKETTYQKSAPSSRMSADCYMCGLRRLECFSNHLPETFEHFQSARKGMCKFPSGTTFIYEGDPAKDVFTVYTGWAFGYTLLEDGRRQILNIYLPGDTIGLSGCYSALMDYSVETAGAVQLCAFDIRSLKNASQRDATLQNGIIQILNAERIHLQQRLISLGRRTSPENLAFLLHTLFSRLETLNLTYGNACVIQLTQTVIADALGLSPEHLNRLLKQLKDDGLVSLNRGKMVIHDRAGLARLARCSDGSSVVHPLL